MSRTAPDTYVQGLRDAVDLAFAVRDLCEQMAYTAPQALDILIGLMQISAEIAVAGLAGEDGTLSIVPKNEK